MFQEASLRVLSNPLALNLLLNRLDYCNSTASRTENRVRVGNSVLVENLTTLERLTFRLVECEKANPERGKVSFTSRIGTQLLGLAFGEIAYVRSNHSEVKWRVISINPKGHAESTSSLH